jgi:hypothetical protein
MVLRRQGGESAFRYVGPANPLLALCDSDRKQLVAFLKLYLQDFDSLSDRADKAERVAAQAATLAREIEVHVLTSYIAGGIFDELLDAIVRKFKDLPERLALFSLQVGGALRSVTGKRGHQKRAARNKVLVTISELVRLKTGNYHDEQLAELLQSVMATVDVKTDDDVSGASIMKKRRYLRRTYPLIYQDAVRRATALARL